MHLSQGPSPKFPVGFLDPRRNPNSQKDRKMEVTMTKNRRDFRTLIAAASLTCWAMMNPVLAQDAATPSLGAKYHNQIFVACQNPTDNICKDLKIAIRSRTNLMPIEYNEINPMALTAYLSTEDGRKSETATIHVFGVEKNFEIRTSVPFPEISRSISYWSNAVSAILADAINSKIGE